MQLQPGATEHPVGNAALGLPSAVTGGASMGLAAVDVETTGLHPVRDRIVEIAVVRLGPNAEKLDEWSTLVDPGNVSLGGRIHGLRPSDLKGAPTFGDIRDELLARLEHRVLVAHNAPFDVAFLQAETVRDGAAWGPVEGLCTMELVRGLGLSKSRKLHQCCADLHLQVGREHVALDDARAVAEILAYLGARLWSIDRPAPAPIWPAPPAGAQLKPRASADVPTPSGAVGRQYRLPPDLDVAPAAATTYLGLLDQVIEDGRVTENEVEALGLFAKACGISRNAARKLHNSYLDEMSRNAHADGVVTDEEQAYLLNLVPLLSTALPR